MFSGTRGGEVNEAEPELQRMLEQSERGRKGGGKGGKGGGG